MKRKQHASAIIACILAICSAIRTSAQTPPSWTWAEQITGPGLVRGVLTASDATGNVCQTGSFASTLQFGATTLTAVPRDMYVVKYSAQGTALWAHQALVRSLTGGSAQAEGISIATDPAGNVYVSGNFIGTVTFGTTVLTASSGTSNTFVVKYSAQGAPLWALCSSSTGGRTDASGLTANANGDVFVSGYFTGTTAFGGRNVTSLGGYDVFLLKINAAGIVQWVQGAGGTGTDSAAALALAPNNGVYLSGSISATATFGALTATSAGGGDAFLASYDAQGTALWVQRYGGTGADGGAGLVVAPTGEIYAVGTFNGTATFGTFNSSSVGNSDGYVLKCSAQGVPLWATPMGGSGADATLGIALNGGALYVGGYFNASATWGNQLLTSTGGRDLFVARYTLTGNTVWAVRGGGTNHDDFAGLAGGSNGVLYLGGQFIGAAQYSPFSLASQGSAGAFWAVLQDNVPTAVRADASAAEVSLYPNPVTGATLTFAVPKLFQEEAVIDILDLTGRIQHHLPVHAERSRVPQLVVNTQVLSPGRYYLRYRSVTGSISKAFSVY